MKLTDDECIQFLDKYVTEKLENEIKKLKFMKTYSAIVNTVNGNGTINVTLAGDNTVISNLKNRTGVTLIVGDSVLLYAPTNSLNNMYVGIKR